MIVNLPVYHSDEVRHWLRNRELGKRPVLGTTSLVRSQLYSSVQCVNQWNPSKTVDETHHGGIFNFDFSPDGSILVAACERKSILMFDPLNGKLIHAKNQAHSDCVNCVRFLDSRTFATCSDDTTVCLWDARFLKHQVRTFRGHSNWVKNIEYAKNKGLLVTSGFDGSIYTWAINSYSDSDVGYKSVFYTNGLMRSKLTPDASKLVIATAGGYLMVIHNLDLDHLADDLSGFKPNFYRLMQMSGSALRQAYSFNHVFTRQRNRVELISDFHSEDEAEMITSLEVHPQGWCVASRNTSKEDKSEWTCIHDIQDLGPYTEADSEIKPNDIVTSIETEEDAPLPLNPPSDNDSSVEENMNTSTRTDDATGDVAGSSSDSDDETNPRLTDADLSSTIQSALEHVRSQFPGIDLRLNLNPALDNADGEAASGNENSLRSLISGQGLGSSRTRRLHLRFGLSVGRPNNGDQNTDNPSGDHRTEAVNDPRVPATSGAQGAENLPGTSRDSTPLGTDTSTVRIGEATTMFIRSGGSRSDRTMVYLGQRKSSPNPNVKIFKNRPRLTHFVPEPNVGRGFIKEVCFSNDGRLICSPFGFGIRLLAFDSVCNELCDCVPDKPMRLFEVTANMTHSIEVVTTKFSPTHPLIVSGCLNGKVDFHQPVF